MTLYGPRPTEGSKVMLTDSNHSKARGVNTAPLIGYLEIHSQLTHLAFCRIANAERKVLRPSIIRTAFAYFPMLVLPASPPLRALR